MTLFEKVLVYHQGALGDFLLACPVFAAVSTVILSKKIFFWTKDVYVHLLENQPFYGGFYPINDLELTPYYSDHLWKEAPIPQACKGTKDLFFFGQKGLKNVVQRLRLRLNNHSTQCYWFSSFPDEKSQLPVSLYIASQIEKTFNIKLTLDHFRIRYREETIKKAREVLGNSFFPIFIHPGSGSIRKAWPIRKWLGLMSWLKTTIPSAALFVILGPADNLVEPVALMAKEQFNASIFKSLPLSLLSALLSLGKLYVGSDSGISHLAAASGVSTVVIFGPTDPSVWAPKGDNVIVIRDEWDPSETLYIPKTGDFPSPDEHIQRPISGRLAITQE